MTASSGQMPAVVMRAVGFLLDFLTSEKNFRDHWFAYVWEFDNIARTATDRTLAAKAADAAESIVARSRELDLRLRGGAGIAPCLDFAEVLLVCERRGLTPPEPRERVAAAVARVSNARARRSQAKPKSKAEDYRSRVGYLFAGHVGLRLGFPLTVGFAEALSQAVSLRPYSMRKYGPALRQLGFLVTHVVYTVSRYNELRIDPNLLAPERAFLSALMPVLMEKSDCELLGECLDALLTCGVRANDRSIRQAREWLAARQDDDGGWSNYGDIKNSVRRDHITIAAIQGLRNYRRTGAGPAHPWIADILRSQPRPRRRRRAPAEKADLRIGRLAWPAAPDTLLQATAAGRPIVLAGAARTFPAWKRWDIGTLRRKKGDVEVAVEVSPDCCFAHPGRPLRRETMAFGDYLDGAGGRETHLYLAEAKLEDGFSDLAADVPLEAPLSGPSEHGKQLWLTVRDSVSWLHHDAVPILHCLFHGRKTSLLFDPAQGALLYPANEAGKPRFSRVDAETPDLETFPLFAHAQPEKLELEGGDALYLPTGWWHHVRSHGETLAVSLWWHHRRRRRAAVR